MGLIMETDKLKNLNEFEDKTLLIVDDDNPFRERLARAMEKKGFKVSQAEGVKKGLDAVKNNKPAFAVVDLRLGDGNGLEVVKEIQNSNSNSRVVMLTGYGNIPTAVGMFPYPVNITTLLFEFEFCISFTTSRPLPSPSLKSTTAKAGLLIFTASIPFFTPSACETLNPFFSIALASLSLKGLSSSTIRRDLSSNSFMFLSLSVSIEEAIWS